MHLLLLTPQLPMYFNHHSFFEGLIVILFSIHTYQRDPFGGPFSSLLIFESFTIQVNNLASIAHHDFNCFASQFGLVWFMVQLNKCTTWLPSVCLLAFLNFLTVFVSCQMALRFWAF
jgi:hypothetical protein